MKPLIAVIGATGTGKSQLAVEIARHFNGEIINGDAMQLYAGLPIITNKMPLEERKNIPHHLLGCIGLDEPTWTVSQFVAGATEKIDEIHKRDRLPILVGGTHYYTQALLFKEAIMEEERHGQAVDLSILEQSTATILAKLGEVDPVMADRWHPNDRRKIQRSLEIWLRTGKRASKIYAEQSQLRQGNGITDNAADGRDLVDIEALGFRYPTLIFWVYSERQALHKRLDARVLKMVQDGLLDEVATLHAHSQEEHRLGSEVDRTKGIWVSIGYKEFQAYQEALSSTSSIVTSTSEQLKAIGIEATQAATRQYSNRQGRWIRIKLMGSLRQASLLDRLFVVDATDVSSYDQNVVQTALDIAAKFLEGRPLPPPELVSDVAKEVLSAPASDDLSRRPDLWERQTCDACGVTVVTKVEWERHVMSNRHRKVVAAQKKRAQNAAAIEARTKGRSPDSTETKRIQPP